MIDYAEVSRRNRWLNASSGFNKVERLLLKV